MHDHTPLTSTRKLDRKRAWSILAVLVTATLAIGAAHRHHAFSRIVSTGTTGTAATSADGNVTLRANLDRTAVMEGEDGLVRMELVLQAHAGENALPQRPTDLVVVLDRSGSMNGGKIRDARAAVKQLISQLAPEDRFALVTFSSSATVAVPFAYATPQARDGWNRSVDDIFASGGTYMGRGLQLGLATLEGAQASGRSPRAILISDGLAAEPHDILRAHAIRTATAEVPLSAVGVGADFDENLMSALADAGTGNYYYLRDANELASVFAAEFATARETVASAVSVSLEPGTGVAVVDAAGYPIVRDGSAATFQPGTLFAGQERRVWITLRVPTDAAAEHGVGVVRVRYRRDGELHQLALNDFPTIACVRDPDRFFASVDSEVWEQSVIVEEYNQLRQSVAGMVAGGREAEAEEEIDRFLDRNATMNRAMASPRVASQIDAAGKLKADIAEAFRGDDAPKKQNLLGKSLHAEGTLERRAGSRK
jgi:Ca-activated chloride channel family protein